MSSNPRAVAVMLVVALAGLGAVPAEARKPGRADTVTLPAVSLPVGSVTEGGAELALVLEFVLQAKGAAPVPRHLGMRMKLALREEVLAVNGAVPGRVKVSYGEATVDITRDGNTRREAYPYAGKTVVRERRDGKVISTDEHGGELPAAVVALENKDHQDFGVRDPVDELLRGRPLVVGQAFVLPPAAGATMIGDRYNREATVAPGTIVLREVSDRLATFEVHFVETRTMSGIGVTARYGGTFVYERADGQLVSAELHAVVSASAGDELRAKGGSASGHGTADIKISAKISVPAGVGVDGGAGGK